MKARYFVFLTLVIGIVSEFIHPNIQTWVPVSVVAYIACGFSVILAICFRKKDKKKFIRAIVVAFIIFTEYAIFSVIAYFRMIDTTIEKGPVAIVGTIVGIIILAIIAFWDELRQRLYIPKK